MSKRKRDLNLAVVETDNTFSKVWYKNREVWQGKCIFCNKKLLVNLDGSFVAKATLEHIIPKSRGGTDDIDNLAIACRHCNGEKGRRHDINKADKQRAFEIIEKLKYKRMRRWKNKDL